MDLSPSAEQQQLIGAFSALYSKESVTERVRAAEPVGHDPQLWRRLLDIGALEMAVDERAGGWGATLLDLALVSELHGRSIGSAPVIEAQVAARLLSRIETDSAAAPLRGVLAGEQLVTVALHQPRHGTLEMVPAGAVADRVVFVDGDHLFMADATADRTVVSNLGSMPVADIRVGAGPVELARGPEVSRAFELALDEWMVLSAHALVGMGNRAIEIGVEYVKERHAFGVPIGSFQAVAHGLADAATAMDGGMLLAREAAWAAEAEPARASELAALAFAFCAESAREATYRSLHYHGGYGFMLEYDIQLYFRRAKAWPTVWVEPDVAYARAAGLRLAPAHGAA
jgi:alkylation response protein AidB-like acyl-CoA dehydrogenase